MYDCFISYNSADAAIAEALHSRLVGGGFTVWFDKNRLRTGCKWQEEIKTGCEFSRIILPVMTPRWQQSLWTKFETYGGETIVPLLFEGECEDVQTPPLSGLQFRDMRKDPDYESLFGWLRAKLVEAAPEKPTRLTQIPFQPNPHFVGREVELNTIHETLHRNPTAALTQGKVQALAAMGGVGKTALAREYIEKFWRCYSQIFWIDARLGFVSEFARLFDLLAPNGADAEIKPPEKAALALRELNRPLTRLLVIDNAADEESIQKWLPTVGHCRTIITSRFAHWSAGIVKLLIHVLDPEPARKLLLTRSLKSSTTGDELAACDELADELGYLPLALEQAAAYIEKRGVDYTFRQYLTLYEKATRELLAERALGSTAYPDPVITTWKTTAQRLSSRARAILRLCAFLASTPIPIAMFVNADVIVDEAAADFPDSVPSSVDPASPAEFRIDKEIRELSAYSMITVNGPRFMVHPLVQTAERFQIPPAALQNTVGRTLRIVNMHMPVESDDVSNWPTVALLRPHIEAIIDLPQALELPEFPRMCSQLAMNHVVHARHSEAEPLMRRALAIETKNARPDNRIIATLLNNLAQLLKDTNRLAEAEPLMRQALAIWEESLGTENAEVAASLNNLAALMMETNRLTEAESLMRQALTIDEKCFGPQHPQTACVLCNLAQLLLSTNRLMEAEGLMRRALRIDEKSFGTEHPRIAVHLNSMARLLQATNRLAEAEPLMRRALDIDQKTFGTEHPRVAIPLSGLAQLLHATNRLAEAEPLMRKALDINEKSFGREHPNVALRLNDLALLLQTTNRLKEAEPLMRQALAIRENSLGAHDPNVATSLNNLAMLLKATNRMAEAEPLMRRVIAIFEKTFGNEHPNVATSLNNLAALLKDTHRLSEAERLMRRALAIDEKSFGLEHPMVAIRLNNLAKLLQDTNRLADAERLMRRVVTIFVAFTRATGHPHPHLQAAIENYAALLAAFGQSGDEIRGRLRQLTRELYPLAPPRSTT